MLCGTERDGTAIPEIGLRANGACDAPRSRWVKREYRFPRLYGSFRTRLALAPTPRPKRRVCSRRALAPRSTGVARNHARRRIRTRRMRGACSL